MTKPVFIIAEAGVNHNGDIELARRLIDTAAEAGADAVKFQTFRAAHMVSRGAPKAEYQNRAVGSDQSQFEMLKVLELSKEHHELLLAHAKNRQIEFLSTPFDYPSLDLLTSHLGLRTIKISSGEITNAPFLLKIGRTATHVILSTGMSTLSEIETALGVLSFGFTRSGVTPKGAEDFALAFASDAGQQALRKRVTLLHCTSEYPTPCNEVNLRAMQAMSAAFGLPVGYSDHTVGIHIALGAVALGASAIEKHFTLDRNLPGPDHQASLEPNELRDLIMRVREMESALGDGVKRPTASEWKNRNIARKSLVASRRIEKGEVFTEENITCKRPGTGVSPILFWQHLGKRTTAAFDIDEPIGYAD